MRTWGHRRYGRLVSAYVDGELDPTATSEVERHIDRCWGCSGAVEQLRLIKASLRNLRDHRPEAIAAPRLRRWAGGLLDGS